MNVEDENNFDFLLDDLDTINDLTKFDDLNLGHKPEIVAAQRCQTSTTSRGNVVVEEQAETVVHYNKFVGRGQDFVPEPQKLATVFRETLYGVSSNF